MEKFSEKKLSIELLSHTVYLEDRLGPSSFASFAYFDNMKFQ